MGPSFACLRRQLDLLDYPPLASGSIPFQLPGACKSKSSTDVCLITGYDVNDADQTAHEEAYCI